MSVGHISAKSSPKIGVANFVAQGRQIVSSSVGSAIAGLDHATQISGTSCGRAVVFCANALKAAEANRQVGRLWAMSSARDGWDGKDASAPDLEGIKAAETLILKLAAGGLDIPTASIGSDGQSTLFWDWGDTLADLDLEPGKATYVVVKQGKPMLHEEDFDPDYIPAYLLTYLLERAAGQ